MESPWSRVVSRNRVDSLAARPESVALGAPRSVCVGIVNSSLNGLPKLGLVGLRVSHPTNDRIRIRSFDRQTDADSSYRQNEEPEGARNPNSSIDAEDSG